MYYIGLDVHKKTISYCVKDVSGGIQQQGTIPATRTNLDELDEDSSSALDGGYGSDHLHRMDLRSSAAAGCTGGSGASIDVAGDCRLEEEERHDRCR